MATGNNVGGDFLNLGATFQVTANNTNGVADKSLLNLDGTVPANGATCTGGVVFKDTANGDYAAVKLPPGIYEVIFTGTVTAGLPVEVLVATVKASISGSATDVVAAGVQNHASGVEIGRALTGGSANETGLVSLCVLNPANNQAT